MKLFKVILVLAIAATAYGWVNACGQNLRFADLLPFSLRQPSGLYNYTALVMLGMTVWGAWRIYGKRSR